ncbi:putative sterigmatocystin biosynthesis dehydrogenase stcV [Mesorhizobium plurifarium]|uniref:Putative sterigmatocystin biosynthesis dehydrogenase stcV n=1 Tax=Mesorhizobium plurifarium TaxID=69974 RepID=A0A090GUX3_MESPL|nr:putative sterigmatocystin biosynthesis dehydrogenase stcV [Mesorhizobium plurifarium]
MTSPLTLASYRLLGSSGLRVSPLCLGTMTFAQPDWGMDRETAQSVFDAYVSAGGNFIDTANFYAQGKSEELIGEFAQGRRDRLVIASKYTLNLDPTDPNGGGNHRKSMMRSVEASLKRLRTDYIDLFYLHMWDKTTPVEEVLRGLDDLVAQGKINYVGISDTPAWQVARMATMADLRGWARPVALQIEYSLVERTVERELVPMAAELGLGVMPFSPVAMGILTGRYSRADLEPAASHGDGRKGPLVAAGMVTEKKISVAETVIEIAREMGAEPAQVAIAWLLTNPAVTSPIIGMRTLAQYESNVGALNVAFSEAHLALLDEASRVEMGFPHDMLASPLRKAFIFGRTDVRLRQEGRRIPALKENIPA